MHRSLNLKIIPTKVNLVINSISSNINILGKGSGNFVESIKTFSSDTVEMKIYKIFKNKLHTYHLE